MASKLRNLAASQTLSVLKSPKESRSVAGKMRVNFDKKSGGVCLNLPASELSDNVGEPVDLSRFIQDFPTDGESFRGVSLGKISKIKSEPVISFHLPIHRLVSTVLEVVGRRDPSYLWMRNALFEDSSVKKVIVEYSSPNIAKPFHVGHLRSTILGNFVANIHEAVGHQVTRINYLGDWGTQFGLLAAGMEVTNTTMEDVKEDPIKKMVEIYIKANKLAEENPDFAKKARDAFTKLENGDEELLNQWSQLREYTRQELQKTYKRLNINFDYFHGEAMYGSDKNTEVIKDMVEKGVLKRHDDGKQVVEIDKDTIVTVVKSDGSSLYASRDIAAALDRKNTFNFDKMCYVVDASQGSHFKNLFQILRLLGHEWSSSCQHVMFGKILGMSTRRGTMVYLSDVLDEARDIMLEMQDKSPNTRIQDQDRLQVADSVGISAVIVNDLKQRRKKDYKFVWEKFLTHKGDTGVKLQYTHARLNSLLLNSEIEVDPTCSTQVLVEQAALELVVLLAQWDEALADSYHQLEPCVIVQYMFNLANATSKALTVLPVKGSPEEVAKARVLLFHCAKVTLAEGLSLLGIIPLDKM